MNRKLIGFCTILVVFAVILSRFAPDKNFSGLHDVTTALENHGYQVAVQEAEKNILRGERYCLTLNHEPDFMVTVYVYDSNDQAEKDAASITPDGFGIEREGSFGIAESMQISWVDAPHFFLYENVIVQYIGMDFDLLQCLYQLCGAQIAGQPFIESPLID